MNCELPIPIGVHGPIEWNFTQSTRNNALKY